MLREHYLIIPMSYTIGNYEYTGDNVQDPIESSDNCCDIRFCVAFADATTHSLAPNSP